MGEKNCLRGVKLTQKKLSEGGKIDKKPVRGVKSSGKTV